MSTKFLRKSKRLGQQAGIALVTTLLLMFLMSSLLVGFTILLISNQQLTGSNNDDVDAFYGAEAGMEQLTANLGNLFAQTYSPTMSQIDALETTPPAPNIPGISYLNGNGSSGYTITLPPTTTYDANGNPVPNVETIKTGPYTGLSAFITEYTLTVNARTTAGREVKLQRSTQTVGIPAFSFGVFASMDLSFFPGPNFNFGGRTHTNGNLWLASGSTLTLSDKVDAYKDVIRASLENGYNTVTNYAGTVQITTNPGSSSYRSLGYGEGSYNPLTASSNSSWPTISTGPSPTDYNHNLINGDGAEAPKLSTGAEQLNLGVALVGNGTTQPVDLIRRGLSGESTTITNERYYSQVSLRVLVSDNPADITNLPCISSGAPFDLSQMATAVNTWSTGGPNNYAPLKTLYNNLVANKVIPLPLAVSGATAASAYTAGDGYFQPNGYPVIKGFIKIDEQTSYGNASGCGTWKDVTTEILGYGYVGRNIDPVPQSWTANASSLNPQWPGTATQMAPATTPALPNLPASALGPQGTQGANALATGITVTAQDTLGAGSPAGVCPDPHPFAIIRLERIRDNPSSVYYNTGALSTKKPTNYPYQSTVGEVCGVDPANLTQLAVTRSGVSTGGVKGTASTWVPQLYDFWPNVLFDTREGELRDAAMSATNQPTLNGAMNYIEIDAKNLTAWFAGTLGGFAGVSGPGTKDPSNASNDFSLYVSDRRGNYEDPTVQSMSGLGWPPLSYTKDETGESGWTDIVNGTENVAAGCPSDSLDTGEDENTGTPFAGSLYYYGAGQKYIHGVGITPVTSLGYGQEGLFKNLSGSALLQNANCTAVPTYSAGDNIWPMLVAAQPNALRQNPPLFFRRAIKIVNGNNLTALGVCPGGNNCGLTIATENPAYLQGDYNANSANGGFSNPNVGASIAADAVTLLSDNWSDVNSFSTAYSLGNRSGTTSYYRTAVLAGVTVPFPQPGGSTGSTVPQDFGTDGGVHNFLRYIESWSGTLNYEGSIVELFYSRQANGTFKCCNTVYSPPSRGYSFDQDFLNPLLLPPRTPLFRDVNTTGWTRLMLANQ
jgi:hypothetical protein